MSDSNLYNDDSYNYDDYNYDIDSVPSNESQGSILEAMGIEEELLDANYSERVFDIEAYESRMLERKKKTEKHHEEALAANRVRRRTILIVAIVIAVLVLSVISGILYNHKKHGLANENVAATVNEITYTESESINIASEDETEDGVKTEDAVNDETIEESFLGFNETVESGSVIVDGVELFKGYNINVNGNNYTLDSESLISKYAILIDAKTGNLICDRDGFERINPASMTKILTVLVAAEHLKEEDLDKKVIISADDTYYAYKSGLSVVGFDVDEEVTVRDLFYGTILPSGADAAAALAEYVAGDMDSFVDMMNEKVRELGLKDSHFTNCVGMYNEEHYSTCADMAMILKAAVENTFCYEVLKEHKYTTTPNQVHEEGILISNWFLRRIEDKETNGTVLCAKTGFVNQSGSCAASYAVQNSGNPYICVTGWAYSAWRCIYDHVEIYANHAL